MIKPVIIHYPSGGFGNYINVLVSLCFASTDLIDFNFKFSETGNSHKFPRKIWTQYDKISGDRTDVILVDSGIDKDYIEPILERFPGSPIIRMCIDSRSKSVVTQTCKYKAERKQFIVEGEDWEKRELFTLMYHHINQTPDFYINNFTPLPECVNINISYLFRNFDRVLEQLSSVFGEYDREKALGLHTDFLSANARYNTAEELVDRVSQALETKNHVELGNYSLHDQGYLFFWLERKYNIKEIPPYDYREWFKHTKEIETCLKLIR